MFIAKVENGNIGEIIDFRTFFEDRMAKMLLDISRTC